MQIGSYTGDGAATQTINVNFKPKFLIIYGNASGGGVHGFVNGVTSEVYAQDNLTNVSVLGGGAFVQFITSSHFIVTNSSIDTSSFNDLATAYFWVGFA